ncbi:MAG: hypothetical protein K6F53_11975 [Lachnospiraceae bacterium]|nr:hypothetical protein [Lachnospiraceae bacterium]
MFSGCSGLSRVINNSEKCINLDGVGRGGWKWYDERNDKQIDYNTFANATAVNLSPRGRTYRPENAPYELYYFNDGTGIGSDAGVHITGVRGDRKGNLTIPARRNGKLHGMQDN